MLKCSSKVRFAMLKSRARIGTTLRSPDWMLFRIDEARLNCGCPYNNTENGFLGGAKMSASWVFSFGVVESVAADSL